MTHVRLTREIDAALTARSEELEISRQEVVRRILRLALEGGLSRATYVPGSTYGIAPLPLSAETLRLALELVGKATNPAYELRRWLAAGLQDLTAGRCPGPRRGTSRRLDGNAGAYPRTPSGTLDAAGQASGALDGNAGVYPRTPGVGMRVDAAVRRGERRGQALAEVVGSVAVLAVFGAVTLLGLVGLLATAAQ